MAHYEFSRHRPLSLSLALSLRPISPHLFPRHNVCLFLAPKCERDCLLRCMLAWFHRRQHFLPLFLFCCCLFTQNFFYILRSSLLTVYACINFRATHTHVHILSPTYAHRCRTNEEHICQMSVIKCWGKMGNCVVRVEDLLEIWLTYFILNGNLPKIRLKTWFSFLRTVKKIFIWFSTYA